MYLDLLTQKIPFCRLYYTTVVFPVKAIIMQLKDHFLFSACYKYFTNNEDVSGSEEAV